VSAKADGVDIKVKGTYEFAFGWVWNDGFSNSVNKSSYSDSPKDPFLAQQRVRVQINFIINEYLQGVYGTETNLVWGRNTGGTPGAVGGTGNASGGAMDSDGVNIRTRWAYLDWLIPNTSVQVRMGMQPVATPSTRLGTPLLNTDVAGIIVSSPTPLDWLSVTAFWLRPYDYFGNDSYINGDGRFGGLGRFDEVDAFGFILPVSIRKIGLDIKPYFIFANIGASSGWYDRQFDMRDLDEDGALSDPFAGNTPAVRDDRTHAIWAGINFDFKLLDPLTIGLDVIYGNAHKNDLGDKTLAVGDDDRDVLIGTRGWFIAATLDYKLDFGSNFSVTPGIFGWWASGDSAGGVENGQYGRLPSIGTNGGNFRPTSFGGVGYFNTQSQYNNGGEIINTGTGTWGVGIQLANATFIKDLTHTLRFAYYRGTNDSDIVRCERDGGLGFVPKYRDDNLYLTTSDSVFEVNFDHTYKIYENLTAALELGWLHLNSDEEVWGNSSFANPGRTGEGKASTNAWKAELLFTFSF
ncbi:MAG: outer membrane homotrimeric porin, partial [Desulfovibrio sp.]|nr:outer membrane homotrimeric porin [Desulfovibrio sp.]